MFVLFCCLPEGINCMILTNIKNEKIFLGRFCEKKIWFSLFYKKAEKVSTKQYHCIVEGIDMLY